MLPFRRPSLPNCFYHSRSISSLPRFSRPLVQKELISERPSRWNPPASQHKLHTAQQTRRLSSIAHDDHIPPSPAQKDTIYALSTPPGRAGIAVIRISGPGAVNVYSSIVKPPASSSRKSPEASNRPAGTSRMPRPWKMHRCSVVDREDGHVIDEGLAVYFSGMCCSTGPHRPHFMSGPKSFTGEDVLELHVHSGKAIIASIMKVLSHIPGCRMAERGEFTRRAFDAGRMDLTQVEGLRDLIEAETEEQRKRALGATQASTVTVCTTTGC